MARRSPLIKAFLSYREIERGLSHNTINSYSQDLTKLQEWASKNNRQIRALSQRDIELWLGQLSRKQLNPASIARALSTTRGFFQFLVLDNYIDTDPTEGLAAPKKTRPLPYVLSVTQNAPTPSQRRPANA
jgi:integrase/recombinase XerD